MHLYCIGSLLQWRDLYICFVLYRLLEVLCTMYCLLLVHTVLFVISTYLELNSHFDHVFCD